MHKKIMTLKKYIIFLMKPQDVDLNIHFEEPLITIYHKAIPFIVKPTSIN